MIENLCTDFSTVAPSTTAIIADEGKVFSAYATSFFVKSRAGFLIAYLMQCFVRRFAAETNGAKRDDGCEQNDQAK